MSHTGVAKVTISLPRDLLARADAARGDEPRSTWIARTLGAVLGVGGANAAGDVPADRVAPAPRRVPAKTDAPETSIEAYMREFR